MNGGADRDRVVTILAQATGITDTSADDVLNELEQAGYVVVRAGQVPRLDALDDVQQRLAALGRLTGHVQRDYAEASRVVDGWLGQLRHVACLVLGIDPDDTDQNDDEGDNQ